ncbi:carboxylate--amine ligase [Flocculibacter collagenilyticus]|uniref:carboxylate--amine ligase n=1 Tax=Flocculibacter collagenilyticus TaxID=2744479 RepID=UPI0018F457DE|nr:hypothetical protein [Flocculibacter collagenilyticus]
MKNVKDKYDHPALVIGLCSHGLAICRALHKEGVPVYAIERDFKLPATHTNTATIIKVSQINDDSLIDELIAIRRKVPGSKNPIIFPTNDKMVGIIAKHWKRLSDYYLLSWSECTETVGRLQLKSELEGICQAQNIHFPQSYLISHEDELVNTDNQIQYPLIVKPDVPMSSFKVALVNDKAELRKLVQDHAQSLPFICQQWIEGDDTRLVFCSMFLIDGKAVSSFVGRKLASYPPTLGQGMIMAPTTDENLLALSNRFFEQTKYTGPASLEFKMDNDGEYWLIEPNMGRTEYSVECAIANGVNLCFVEYLYEINKSADLPVYHQNNTRVWLDTEKSALIYLKHVLKHSSFKVEDKRPCFPYMALHDIKPSIFSLYKTVKRTLR